MRLKNSFPYWLVQNRRAFRHYAMGLEPRECNICGYGGKFRAAGFPLRPDSRCPECDSLERHRLLLLGIDELGLLKSTDTMVHFAAEPPVREAIKSRVGTYTTADLFKPEADVKLDIERMELKDGSVDVLLASHVLEHVNDRLALAEIFRVLRPGGRLIAMVPIVEGWESTYENPAIDDPHGRNVHFGQFDHVRFYGRDFRDRIESAGFRVEEFSASPEVTVRRGLVRGDRLFIGRKD